MRDRLEPDTLAADDALLNAVGRRSYPGDELIGALLLSFALAVDAPSPGSGAVRRRRTHLQRFAVSTLATATLVASSVGVAAAVSDGLPSMSDRTAGPAVVTGGQVSVLDRVGGLLTAAHPIDRAGPAVSALRGQPIGTGRAVVADPAGPPALPVPPADSADSADSAGSAGRPSGPAAVPEPGPGATVPPGPPASGDRVRSAPVAVRPTAPGIATPDAGGGTAPGAPTTDGGTTTGGGPTSGEGPTAPEARTPRAPSPPTVLPHAPRPPGAGTAPGGEATSTGEATRPTGQQ